jgi:hypothetical protein
MISAWTSNLKDPESQVKFEKKLLGSKAVLQRLKDILFELKKDLDNSNKSLKDFEDPNWANKQAFKNGFEACLATVNKLIDLDQQQFQTAEKL